MSFILDALKKSENERARQNGPALLESRVVPRRRGVPAWAIAIGVVLLANFALLAYVLMRAPSPAADAAPAVPADVTPAPQAAVVAPPLPAPGPAPAQPTATVVLPPLPLPAQSSAAPALSGQEVAAENPADFRPALPAETPRAQNRGATGTRGADAGLPSAADLAATGLPELRLALHAYDDDPANRYVLMNSQRLREGDTAAEGVRVERITTEGVVLSWRGRQFRLQPGD